MNGKDEGGFSICSDTSDCIELSFASGLYLKPITKLNITVTIPRLKPGQVISNKEIIDKLALAIRPEKFYSIKATKSNVEFLRFDAELGNRKKVEFVISKIDQKGIKLAGFNDVLKIRSSEGKIPFPSRHDWDSYFRDAKHMNEKKPGERPDTVYIKDVPSEWFIHRDDITGSCPSIYVVSKVFSSFGEIRAIDIPCLDPHRKDMSADISGINKFSSIPEAENTFEFYVQYKEYVGFAKCMHTLQAKKLVIQRDETVYMCNIKVDFDKSKHLSDASMKRREIEREKLMAASINTKEKNRMKKAVSAMKKDAELIERHNLEEKERKRVEEKEDKKKAKEEKRKQKELRKRLRKLMAKHKDLTDIDDMEKKLTKKVETEEQKQMFAQRNVEAVRLFDKIFDRIKTYHQKEAAIRTTLSASGIHSEPEMFGNWFNKECQQLMKKKKMLHLKFVSDKSNENWLHYKKCSHKLKKLSHNQKLKFMGSCLKNAKGTSSKEIDEKKRKELASCKKVLKLSKARLLDQMQTQQSRLERVVQGKIQVIFLPCDDENKVALSPASSGASSSSSGSMLSDESDSDKERKNFAGKLRSDQIDPSHMNFYGNQGNEHFQGNYFHGNYRPRGAYGMGQGQHFPYDNRGRGFRFHRPYFNRGGFRGGQHQQGFDNRGRGFYHYRGRFPYDKSRGRGGYIDYKKLYEHPIKLGHEKWFKKGNEEGEEEEKQDFYNQSYTNKPHKENHRSPSWSMSPPDSRHRSWSRSRSRSYSRSRSRSEKRRSSEHSRYSNHSRRRVSRSSSRSSYKSKSRSRSRSPKKDEKIKKQKSKKKTSKDKSSKRKNKKRLPSSDGSSRSRSRTRRSTSPIITSNGKDKRKKSVKNRNRSKSSDSSRSRNRNYEKSIEDRYRDRSMSSDRYSDRSYSRSPSMGRQYGNYYDEEFENRRYQNDFRGRGRGRGTRPFYNNNNNNNTNNFRGNQRQQRRPRGNWRGNRPARGYYTNNYDQNDQEDDYNEQYMRLYKKYFNRISKRNSSSDEESYNPSDRQKLSMDMNASYDRQKLSTDMNASYREEEERNRSKADKIQQHDKAMAKWRKKRNIRERMEDSDEDVPVKRARRRSSSTSDVESLYGPTPPKHIKSKLRKV